MLVGKTLLHELGLHEHAPFGVVLVVELREAGGHGTCGPGRGMRRGSGGEEARDARSEERTRIEKRGVRVGEDLELSFGWRRRVCVEVCGWPTRGGSRLARVEDRVDDGYSLQTRRVHDVRTEAYIQKFLSIKNGPSGTGHKRS